MNHCFNRTAWTAFLLMAAVCTSAEPPPPDTDSTEEIAEPESRSGESVPELVERLGSSSFAERQAATERLFAMCPGAFDALAETFRQTDDFETRIRIQDLVERAFFDSRLLRQSGFLGVALQSLNSQLDPRLEPGRGAVLVHDVVDGTAASRAKLQVNDVIFEVNGRPFPEDVSSDSFSNMIRQAGPGTQLLLSIHREDSPEPVVVPVTLGARPLEHYNDPDNAQRLEETAQEFRRWWAEKFEGIRPESLEQPGPPDED